MNWLQKMVVSLLPQRLARSIEAESRAWLIQCDGCEHEQSVWEYGGIRWKAKGSPRLLRTCRACHQKQWHTVRKSSNR